MVTNKLIHLYVTYTGKKPEQIEEFGSSGSHRRYFRLKSKPTLVGVSGESVAENRAFFYLSRHFSQKGLPVPKVVAQSADDMLYLQEDLGDTLLFNAIEQGRTTGIFSEMEKLLLHKTIRLLPQVQCLGAEGLDFTRCHPQAAFDSRTILWDLNYFKYCFLKASGLDFQENQLEDDFQKMVNILLEEPFDTFMYRDFQSRNVMIKENEPWLIDFQDGRKGPLYYDVASFLWQAKANYPTPLREELLQDYIQALQSYRTVDEAHFREHLRHFLLFRLLQVLGAYGFRGLFERKSHFLQSIPLALENLRNLLEEPFPQYPFLCELLLRLTELKQFTGEKSQEEKSKQPVTTPHTEESLLKVTVTSFSYKRGVPQDPTQHGGGFVFDCRALHNPGRYECFRLFTGRDEPVIRFLEEKGEIIGFLEHSYALVDATVQRYIARGFTHLSVCFGCTGGQHRSVYSAQHLAEHLHQKFNIRVELLHRELQIEQTFLPHSTL